MVAAALPDIVVHTIREQEPTERFLLRTYWIAAAAADSERGSARRVEPVVAADLERFHRFPLPIAAASWPISVQILHSQVAEAEKNCRETLVVAAADSAESIASLPAAAVVTAGCFDCCTSFLPAAAAAW